MGREVAQVVRDRWPKFDLRALDQGPFATVLRSRGFWSDDNHRRLQSLNPTTIS